MTSYAAHNLYLKLSSKFFFSNATKYSQLFQLKSSFIFKLMFGYTEENLVYAMQNL